MNRQALLILAALALPLGGGTHASTPDDDQSAGPQPLAAQNFDALINHSPFTRHVNLSGKLTLSGVAVVDGSFIATVFNLATGHSSVVSDSPNAEGWQLLDIENLDDPAMAVAIIAVAGGETVRVHHQQPSQNRHSAAHRLASMDGSTPVPDWVHEIEDPEMKGVMIQSLIEGGAFDEAPFKAVEMALAVQEPKARGPALSAAFGRLGGGVGGIKNAAAINRLNALPPGRDRDFAINGLAHGLARRDPAGALEWANSISQEGFRKVVVRNVTQRIEGQTSRSRGR